MNKKFILMIGLVMGSSHAIAGGIPVFDGANLTQSALQSAKELAQMAKQLVEARNQLVELKNQVNAMTGIKGFSDILELGGLDSELVGSFDDLLNGNASSLLEKSSKYFDKKPSCTSTDSKTRELCEGSSLGSISTLDFIEKLNGQFEKKLDKITELSERLKTASDIKSVSEVQANIALETNSIALLQQQATNFYELNKTKQKIYLQRAMQQHAKNEWDNLEKASASSRLSNSDYSNLLN